MFVVEIIEIQLIRRRTQVLRGWIHDWANLLSIHQYTGWITGCKTKGSWFDSWLRDNQLEQLDVKLLYMHSTQKEASNTKWCLRTTQSASSDFRLILLSLCSWLIVQYSFQEAAEEGTAWEVTEQSCYHWVVQGYGAIKRCRARSQDRSISRLVPW